MRRKVLFRRGRHRSSRADREVIQNRLNTIKCRQEEIRARQHELQGWQESLVSAARFVLDVDGDPAAVATLNGPTDAAEEFLELSEESRELFDERRKTEHRRNYYQHRAVENHDVYDLVIAEADTLAELKTKVRASQQKEQRNDA